MPVTNFEHITEELTDQEIRLIPILMKGFASHDENNPIKAPDIVSNFNKHLKAQGIQYKLTQPRLRKCVNYIRSKGLLPLIATSKGYFVSKDRRTIADQVKSLRQRASSINSSASGLEKFLAPNEITGTLFNLSQHEIRVGK